MSKKKIAAVIMCIMAAVLLNIYLINKINIGFFDDDYLNLNIQIKSDFSDDFNVYYSDSGEFTEEQTTQFKYKNADEVTKASFVIKPQRYLRIDFGVQSGVVEIDSAQIEYQGETVDIMCLFENTEKINGSDCISEINYSGEKLKIVVMKGDPYIVVNTEDSNIYTRLSKKLADKRKIISIILCIIVDLFVLIGVRYINRLAVLPVELYRDRKLIASLAKNDFKTKFAGSYLGIVWAFIQPIVTVLVYWFVFEVGLKAGKASDFPFILWLMSGIVPWFFFSEALNGGTNALTEYTYLVKKVVFKISILPIVKIISSIFVHLFFVAFVILLCWVYGYYPDLYSLQLVYYIGCTFVLVLGLSYLTSAVVCFFKDLTQIINIILQVGMWMTPIMWDSAILSPTLQTVFRLNPMYYVVDGFRDALLSKVWFWDKPIWTVYFWIVVVVLFAFGATVFKKLRVHFADVL